MHDCAASAERSYHQCLSASGRNPAKCRQPEAELRAWTKKTGKDYCIDEIIDLLNCTRSPDRDLCSKPFIQMRECNRPRGPQILVQDGNYVAAPAFAQSHFNLREGAHVAAATPPLAGTTDQSVRTELAAHLQLPNLDHTVSAYKW